MEEFVSKNNADEVAGNGMYEYMSVSQVASSANNRDTDWTTIHAFTIITYQIQQLPTNTCTRIGSMRL